MDTVILTSGIVAGYSIHEIFGAEKEGDDAFGMLRYESQDGWFIHIHHWIIHMIILIIACIYGNVFVAGFSLGGLIQGLTYSDWYQIYGSTS